MPASAKAFVSRLLVAAVVCLSLAPPQHVHRGGIEGRAEALVHAHGAQAADARHAGSEAAVETFHGDHRLAVALGTDSTSPPRVSLSPDATLTRACAVSRDLAVTALYASADARPPGLPRSVGAGRGPPPVI